MRGTLRQGGLIASIAHPIPKSGIREGLAARCHQERVDAGGGRLDRIGERPEDRLHTLLLPRVARLLRYIAHRAVAHVFRPKLGGVLSASAAEQHTAEGET